MACIVTDKVIVLANARTASMSVTQYFHNYPNSFKNRAHHMSLEEVKIRYAPHLTGRELVVANVRNPWDVMASWWMLSAHNEWNNNFAAFCKGFGHSQLFDKRMFTHHLIDLDYIIRFETLTADVLELCDRIDLPQLLRMPHVNKTPKKKPYTKYYEKFPEAVDIVRARFSRVIVQLGYTYE